MKLGQAGRVAMGTGERENRATYLLFAPLTRLAGLGGALALVVGNPGACHDGLTATPARSSHPPSDTGRMAR